MTVAINYQGRMFNRWTEYCFARLVAEKNELTLETPWVGTDFITVEPFKPGKTIAKINREIHLKDSTAKKTWGEIPKAESVRYVVDGFFQHAEWVFFNWERILEFARPTQKTNTLGMDVVVIHLRRGDYEPWRRIPISWYTEILDKENFSRLFVVCERADAESKDVDVFRKYKDMRVISGSPVNDWNFLRGAARLIISNSSYAFWAAFFSLAKVWVHTPWFSQTGSQGEVGDSLVTLDNMPGWVKVSGLFEARRLH